MPKPSFSYKSIYQLWYSNTSKQWRRDDDELKSAQILIAEALKNNEESYTRVENIPLHTGDAGYSAISFSLPELLRKWGGRIRELSLDSACKFSLDWFVATNPYLIVNTNASHYEIYALIGEVFGSGCPLGFLLVQSPKDSIPGAKERYIQDLLRYFRDSWSIQPIATLTDKDWSEINAFHDVFPTAKHQLCFWHSLDAIKKRLAVLRRRPAHYDVDQAMHEFEFIDKKFVPIAQSKERNPVSQNPLAYILLKQA